MNQRMYCSIVSMLLLSLFVVTTASCQSVTRINLSSNRERVVFILQGKASCSGVVVKTNLVVTAAHCIDGKEEITVDGKPAKVINTDTKNDIASLEVVTKKFSKLRFYDAEQTDDVYAFGYPYASPNVVFTQGYVSVIQFDSMFTTAKSSPGSSGSPMYNNNGKLVGIVVGNMTSTGFSVVVPVDLVRKLLDGGKEK